MCKEIVVDINPSQTRVALVENGAPTEIYVERRGKERMVGNIYIGRVQNVLPGMQAAFVDIGHERNAFLYAGDIQVDHQEFQFEDNGGGIKFAPQNIKDIVHQGQDIMVQVLKEPVGTKGARVTTHITLPGRTLVLMPSMNYVGVSRRIEDETERARLKAVLDKIKPENMGVIVRTAAVGKSEEEFAVDLDFLVRLWNRIREKARLVSAPRLLHAEEPLIFRTIRDLFTQDVERLIINDREFYERVEVVAGIISPALKDRVEYYEAAEPSLFDRYDLETKIDKALQRKVWMKNGGYIIIDQTEALTTIDVNTGKFVGVDNLQETITQTNCEAAKEIARQIRLRDISGIIVIDFIDMDEIVDKESVLETLRSELKKDRTKSNVLGITALGLVEMTRKKARHSMSATLQSPCPYCKGDGKVLSSETMVLKVRRHMIRCFEQQTHACYLVKAHPAVAALIDDQSTELSPLLPQQEGRTIYVQADKSMHLEQFEVMPLSSADELKDTEGQIKAYT